MAWIFACGYFEGLRTASNSVAKRERLVAESGLPARTRAMSSASLVVAAGAGFVESAAVLRSLVNLCFCCAVNAPSALKEERADCNRVRLMFWTGGVAVEGGGCDGCTGGVTPCRTLLWLTCSRARCLAIGPA